MHTAIRSVILGIVLSPLCATGAARADTSSFSSQVGTVGIDDKTMWCNPALLSSGGVSYVRSSFQLRALDGGRADNVGNPVAAQRARLQCFPTASRTGPSVTLTSGWSTDAQGDVVTVQCPAAKPFGAFPQCQVDTVLLPPYVYRGSACGNGVTSITPAQIQGQLTGQFYEMTPVSPPKPLFNNTVFQAGVAGTDLGFTFLAGGQLYMGFGDTWDNEAGLLGPLGLRGSVLAHTTDFDPSDANGIAFTGWDTVPGNPFAAREVVPSFHDLTSTTEFDAIATAGFGLTEGNITYRFLWFTSIKQWGPPGIGNWSTLAWSANSGTFVRGDLQFGANPPVWSPGTFQTGDTIPFSPGAVWVDRWNGYIYFFGVQRTDPAANRNSIRLARVPARVSAVLDRTQYSYWTSTGWVQDASGSYQPALDAGGRDVIPVASSPDTLISVGFDSYANVWLLMLQNLANSHFELWQSSSPDLTQWSQVNTGSAFPQNPNNYGPYLSEHIMRSAGRDVYFALSEWDFVVPGGEPYNVGLWKYSVNRAIAADCNP